MAAGLDTESQAVSLGTIAVLPSGDVVKTGVVGVGDTASLWRDVDDGVAFTSSDNDSTYVSSGTSASATHILKFAGGKAGIASKVVVRYRARNAGATGTIRITLRDRSSVVPVPRTPSPALG
jgi:hypothetical protein